MATRPRLRGVAFVLIASIGFGLAPTFANFSFAHGANAVGVLLARFTIASILMLIARPFFVHGTAWPSRRLSIQIFLLGSIGFFLGTLLYFTALKNIDSGLAVVIFYSNPVFIVLLSWWINQHKPNRVVLVCLVFTLIGVAITVGQVGGGNLFSVLLVLGASVEYSIYMIISVRVMPKTDLFTGVNIVMIGAASSYALYWLFAPSSVAVNFPTDLTGWTNASLLGVISTAGATVAMFAGVKVIGAPSSSVVMTFEPIVAILAGHLFFAEQLSSARIVGGSFVIGAVLTLALVESRSTLLAEQNIPIHP
ncbi:MAG: DMT family transporter [Ilumatobacteraceae bacterium]